MKEDLLWILSIILMAVFSFSAYPEINKVRIVKPKKSKTEQMIEQQKEKQKKEVQEEEREHECEKEYKVCLK